MSVVIKTTIVHNPRVDHRSVNARPPTLPRLSHMTWLWIARGYHRCNKHLRLHHDELSTNRSPLLQLLLEI